MRRSRKYTVSSRLTGTLMSSPCSVSKLDSSLTQGVANWWATGVQEVFTDQARSEVVVFGFADSHDVLRKARKVDKRADILSTDSFTLHHKHSHKHNKIHHKHKHYRSSDHYGYGHGHGRSGTHYPIETVAGSPRYNSSFNQASSGYGSRYGSITSGYDVMSPEYRHRQSNVSYRPELEYRHGLHDGYRSEPGYYHGEYRPQYLETRSVYDEYRPELDHRSRYSGYYRPSQSYPPGYLDGRDYRDSPYPDAFMNPEYLKQMDVY